MPKISDYWNVSPYYWDTHRPVDKKEPLHDTKEGTITIDEKNSIGSVSPERNLHIEAGGPEEAPDPITCAYCHEVVPDGLYHVCPVGTAKSGTYATGTNDLVADVTIRDECATGSPPLGALGNYWEVNPHPPVPVEGAEKVKTYPVVPPPLLETIRSLLQNMPQDERQELYEHLHGAYGCRIYR